MNTQFSDYVVYVDESGDHSLQIIDPDYPIFVLAFCIFHKQSYINEIVPKIQQLKFDYFGHDMVILHEREIRKAKNSFSALVDQQIREAFINRLNNLIELSPFTIISAAIKKHPLQEKYSNPTNPYHLALTFGLERIYTFLQSKKQPPNETHIIFENRGKKEDNELELEFRRVCNGSNWHNANLPFNIIFADKQTNSCGLQLADLIARPIGRHLLKPEQSNRAYELIDKKFYRNGRGEKKGFGLKCFP